MGWLNNNATAASNTTIEGIASTTAAPMSNIDNIVMALAAQGRMWIDDIGGANTVGGTANAITVTLAGGALAAFADKDSFSFVAIADNTAHPVTVTVYGGASATVYKSVDGTKTNLVAGDIRASNLYTVRYRTDWTGLQLLDWNSSLEAATIYEFSNLSTALVVTSAETIASNNNDTTWPTSAAVKDYADANLPTGAVVPVGAILDYAGSTAPSKWAFCYGQEVSRATYSALFTAISTTYGIGDGANTFNLPDLRGRIVAGQDDMGGVSADRLTNQTGGLDGDTLAATGGAETHVLTDVQAPLNNINDKSMDASGQAVIGRAATHDGDIAASAHNNVQPTIMFNKIIYLGA